MQTSHNQIVILLAKIIHPLFKYNSKNTKIIFLEVQAKETFSPTIHIIITSENKKKLKTINFFSAVFD